MKTTFFEDPQHMEAGMGDPFISFSHLAACFPHNAIDTNEDPMGYGFIPPREETLYETGILSRTFMKC